MSSTALAVIETQIAERGIPPPTWNTMLQTLYPGSSPASVLLAWDYCQARKLDPLKKPVHIVPMTVKVGNEWVTRDTILPGIYEYRITAHRTGEYLGHDKPIYGPKITAFGVEAPESCEFTVYRWNDKAKQKVAYPVTVYFREVCGTKRKSKDNPELVANGRWERAPVQMLTKCAEAAALREAFPEEIGGEPTAEEIDGHMPDVIDVTAEQQEIPTAWGRIADGLRDTLEKAFATLKMTAAQRLAKVNEFIRPGVDADSGAEKLLEWCKDEFARQQGKTRKVESNAKEPKGDRTPTAAASTAAVAGPSTPNGGDSASKESGPEAPPTIRNVPAASTPEVPEGQIPWTSKKTNDLSELF